MSVPNDLFREVAALARRDHTALGPAVCRLLSAGLRAEGLAAPESGPPEERDREAYVDPALVAAHATILHCWRPEWQRQRSGAIYASLDRAGEPDASLIAFLRAVRYVAQSGPGEFLSRHAFGALCDNAFAEYDAAFTALAKAERNAKEDAT